MRRVLLVLTGLGLGGAETQVVMLARRLKQRGWGVRVVSLVPPRELSEDLRGSGIPWVSLDMRSAMGLLPAGGRLIRQIRLWSPDVVHAHMVHANLLARVARLLAPVPVLICTAHSTNESGRKGSSRWREFLYRVTDPLCDLSTQVSAEGLERYIRVRAFRRLKARHVPNGVDTERFRPNPEERKKLRAELGAGEAFVWLAVGRLDRPKDYSTMLRACALLTEERSDARLWIAGDGPLRPALEELAAELEISRKVRFLGIRRDVPSLMNAADAFVMSSFWEGLPMVLLEAQATGLPVVATAVGGCGEIVRAGETGYVVPPRDPQALARAMADLMNLSDSERHRMSENARRWIADQFSLERIVDQWEALYEQLLGRSGGRPRRVAPRGGLK